MHNYANKIAELKRQYDQRAYAQRASHAQQQVNNNPAAAIPPELMAQANGWADFFRSEKGRECLELLNSEFAEFQKGAKS